MFNVIFESVFDLLNTEIILPLNFDMTSFIKFPLYLPILFAWGCYFIYLLWSVLTEPNS